MLANSFLDDVTDQFTVATSLRVDKPGYTIGMLREENGKLYRLAKAGAAIPINAACKPDSAATSGDIGYQVVKTAVAGEGVSGVAEIAVTSGYYFWLTVGRVASVLVTGTVAIGDRLAATATAGTLSSLAAATYGHVCAHALEANASGAATKKVHLLVGI